MNCFEEEFVLLEDKLWLKCTSKSEHFLDAQVCTQIFGGVTHNTLLCVGSRSLQKLSSGLFCVHLISFERVSPKPIKLHSSFNLVLKTLKTAESERYKVFTRQQQSAFMSSCQSFPKSRRHFFSPCVLPSPPNPPNSGCISFGKEPLHISLFRRRLFV